MRAENDFLIEGGERKNVDIQFRDLPREQDSVTTNQSLKKRKGSFYEGRDVHSPLTASPCGARSDQHHRQRNNGIAQTHRVTWSSYKLNERLLQGCK